MDCIVSKILSSLYARREEFFALLEFPLVLTNLYVVFRGRRDFSVRKALTTLASNDLISVQPVNIIVVINVGSPRFQCNK